ncbi:MAG: hypothetical protein IJK43_00205 [Prevotella sp.]|nr:hypothetical protein [Prevotella sp.]
MKKKQYSIPSVKISNVGVAAIICASGNTVTSTTGEVDYGGGGSGPARARQYNAWEDDGEEQSASSERPSSLIDLITREQNGHQEWL